MDEFANLIGRRYGYGFAADRVSDLYASPSAEIVASTGADEIEAITMMRKFADQKISFTDCTSFAIMRRLGLRTAFTFDRHFRAAGFQIVPKVRS